MPKQTTRPELSRDLGVSHASAVVVGTIIGSGIFLVPAEMMQAVGSAKLVYLAWLVGGLLSFFGALTYAELGAMKPQAGGEYVYVRDAYGPLGGISLRMDLVRYRQTRIDRHDRYWAGSHSRHFPDLLVFSCQCSLPFLSPSPGASLSPLPPAHSHFLPELPWSQEGR